MGALVGFAVGVCVGVKVGALVGFLVGVVAEATQMDTRVVSELVLSPWELNHSLAPASLSDL